jgi:MFS family permease
LFLPLSLLYATRVVGLDVGVAGTVVAAATALSFAVPPLAGRLTHRFGPRFVAVCAQVVQCVGALAYLVAGSAFGVLVAAGLMAAGVQLFYCSVFVLIADVSRDEAKERPFALVAMVRGAAFGLGALIAAAVLTLDSDAAFRLLVAVDAITFIVAAALLASCVVIEHPDPHAPAAAGPLTVLRDRGYLALMASNCLVGLAMDVSLLGAPVFFLEVLDGPAWLPGVLLAGGTVLSSLYGVRVVDALRGRRRTRSLQAGAVIFAVWAALTMGMLWLPDGWLIPYACGTWVVMVVGTKIFYPISGALSEALPPRQDRAGYMATYQYAFTTAQVLGPAVVALFAVAAWLPWTVVAASALGAVVVLGWLGRTIPAALNRSPAAVLVP